MLINGVLISINLMHLLMNVKNISLFSLKFSSFSILLFSSKKHLIIFPIACKVKMTVSSHSFISGDELLFLALFK